MIPKIIYYCWFGNPMPQAVHQRIERWKSILPEYTFVEINEKNFDYHQYAFTNAAYEAEKFAYVSDVARLDFLYRTGGIYLDTDVDVNESFDSFLQAEVVQLSMEYYGYEITGVNVGTIISPPQHPFIQHVKELIIQSVYHEQRPPVNEYFNQSLPNLLYRNKEQVFTDISVHIYRAEVFCKQSKHSVTVHHYDHSWGEKLTRFQKVKRICGVIVKKCIGRNRLNKLMKKGEKK